MTGFRKLLCLTLCLVMLAACGNVDTPPNGGTTAAPQQTTASSTQASSVGFSSLQTSVPAGAEFVDLSAVDSDWLTVSCDYTSRASEHIKFTADMDGASFCAVARQGGLFCGSDNADARSVLEFSSGELVCWQKGQQSDSETFIDVVACKDGYIVGYATVLVRDRAVIEFDLIDAGVGYVAELVTCKTLPSADGRYQAVPLAQIEAELEKVHTSQPPLGTVNLYYEWTGYRFYNALLSSQGTKEVCIALTSDDPEVSFRARVINGDIFYAEPKEGWPSQNAETYKEMTVPPHTTISWKPDDEVDTETTCYVEITVFKGRNIVGYSLVRIGKGESPLYGKVNLYGTIEAYAELDTPITESELETIFAGLKEEAK